MSFKVGDIVKDENRLDNGEGIVIKSCFDGKDTIFHYHHVFYPKISACYGYLESSRYLKLVRTKKQETMCRHLKELGAFLYPERHLRDLQFVCGLDGGNSLFENNYYIMMKLFRERDRS